MITEYLPEGHPALYLSTHGPSRVEAGSTLKQRLESTRWEQRLEMQCRKLRMEIN